jgi:ubiquinone/menaquinone biosynthesis C-methylase UbiE
MGDELTDVHVGEAIAIAHAQRVLAADGLAVRAEVATGKIARKQLQEADQEPPMTEPLDTDSLFDREAGRYDAAHDREAAAVNALHIRLAVTLRLLGRRAGAVIDCGMGPGRLLVELERRGWSVAGVDVSGEMVALARSRLPRSAERLQQAPVESLPFASESFDAAVATGVFEYVEDVPRALTEVARVLRPGGLFVISMPNTRAAGTIWRHRVVYRIVRPLKTRLRVGRRMPLPRPG